MRGEENALAAVGEPYRELPPHARRRADSALVARSKAGITSACAEKRAFDVLALRLDGNYLRMRGEEFNSLCLFQHGLELPPHARRRVDHRRPFLLRVGITSACAEKRNNRAVRGKNRGNYLRMRGEEI